MNKQPLIAMFMMGGSLLIPSLHAAPPTVYPTPRQIRLADTTTRVTSTAIHKRSPESAGPIWDRLPDNNEDAYALEIGNGKLDIYANSETGVYYARQTLSQLLQGIPEARSAQKDPFPDKEIEEIAQLSELPVGTIIDWPDLPFRGAVEGYYGAPWSFEARQSQFEFYGRNKLNTYIYAPKDDPYHHGMGCYQPYPEEKAQEIRDLVQQAHKNHVRFVWAIHPANTVKWSENGGRTQLNALCRKLELMYGLGVRDFGVLVDDSSGEIGKPERQVELTNYILENFIRKHPDVNQTLIMCPTGYNRSWTSPGFLQALGKGLDPSIPVMWTGDTVVHDITLEGQKWVNRHVMRPTFIWWNWPCNDYKRSRLSMGRTYGLGQEEEMKNEMSGFVANPMEHAEASKVGLFGVADYTWNITGFDSVTSWKDGISRLYPQCSQAMQTFCDHNSYLLPNTHGYDREESIEIAPIAQELADHPENATPETIAKLRAEYEKMAHAGETLQKTEGIAAFQKEAAPWIRQFILTGQAGMSILDALQEKEEKRQMSLFFATVDTLARMESVTRNEWMNGRIIQKADVEVAMRHMTPALSAVLSRLNTKIYAALAGRPGAKPVFFSNIGNPEQGARFVADGNPSTFWSSGQSQQAGQWISLDFGHPTDIRNVILLMGGQRAQDYVKEGRFEISMDGEEWLEIGKAMGGHTVVLNLAKNPVRTRMIRYRITQAKRNWLSVCEFAVNTHLPAYVSSNMASHPLFTVARDERAISINRIMENFPILPGEYIDLELPAPIHPQWLEINLENAGLDEWAKIELTLSDGKRVPIKGKTEKNRLFLKAEQLPDKPISSLRLTHAGDQSQDIKITLFRLGLPPQEPGSDPASLTDGNLASSYDCGKEELEITLPLPEGTRELIVVGTADCTATNATLLQRTAHTQRFTLEAEKRSVTLRALKQPGKRLYEVIFR